MDFVKYFNILMDWKKLPAYKLEPRIDSFIGYYLTELISHYKRNRIIDIIPEFPIRKKTVFETFSGERSFKVDFLAISNDNPNYLVEFKTDLYSRRKKQDEYLFKAQEKKLGALINGIKYIYKATAYKNKYDHLINKLKQLSLINDNLEFIGKNEEIEIIYIQPSNDKNENNIIDFKQISSYLNNRDNIDIFEKELSNALLEWINDS
jgi:hypothetical protein